MFSKTDWECQCKLLEVRPWSRADQPEHWFQCLIRILSYSITWSFGLSLLANSKENSRDFKLHWQILYPGIWINSIPGLGMQKIRLQCDFWHKLFNWSNKQLRLFQRHGSRNFQRAGRCMRKIPTSKWQACPCCATVHPVNLLSLLSSFRLFFKVTEASCSSRQPFLRMKLYA